MSDDLIAIVREVMDEIYNFGNVGIADELFDKDFVSHTSQGDMNLTQFKDYITAWKSGFPDLHFNLEYIHQEGDIVSWTVRILGTNKSDFMGASATGKSHDITMVNRMRAVNGRPIEHWVGVELEQVVEGIHKD